MEIFQNLGRFALCRFDEEKCSSFTDVPFIRILFVLKLFENYGVYKKEQLISRILQANVSGISIGGTE